MYISSQLEGLRPHYDVRCLCIPTDDRSTYEELAQITADFIAQERVSMLSMEGLNSPNPFPPVTDSRLAATKFPNRRNTSVIHTTNDL